MSDKLGERNLQKQVSMKHFLWTENCEFTQCSPFPLALNVQTSYTGRRGIGCTAHEAALTLS